MRVCLRLVQDIFVRLMCFIDRRRDLRMMSRSRDFKPFEDGWIHAASTAFTERDADTRTRRKNTIRERGSERPKIGLADIGCIITTSHRLYTSITPSISYVGHAFELGRLSHSIVKGA